jgi:hypothetical protein
MGFCGLSPLVAAFRAGGFLGVLSAFLGALCTTNRCFLRLAPRISLRTLRLCGAGFRLLLAAPPRSGSLLRVLPRHVCANPFTPNRRPPTPICWVDLAERLVDVTILPRSAITSDSPQRQLTTHAESMQHFRHALPFSDTTPGDLFSTRVLRKAPRKSFRINKTAKTSRHTFQCF